MIYTVDVVRQAMLHDGASVREVEILHEPFVGKDDVHRFNFSDVYASIHGEYGFRGELSIEEAERGLASMHEAFPYDEYIDVVYTW